MATEIRVPTLGESVSEATVGKWLKKVGDAVSADEPLVELETDKVAVEVPAPTSGVIASVAAAEGATVEVGGLLGAIEANGKATSVKEARPAAAAKAASVAAKSEAPLSPAPRRAAAELGVDPSSIKGAGKDGRVTKGDV
ncbi:MAG: E3 binding domain-containing protein, partial [Parvularculaceae bacterium]|nr:E3 binding domain-containing protein [Parvularculaceae bacterium]